MKPDFAALKAKARSIREKFLKMHFENQSGHIGTGLSSIDLLTYLYAHVVTGEDRFILSKGHGASALYATLNHFGILSDEKLATYYKDGTLLPAHPAPGAWEAIPAATGSLGHGLSIGAGLAYASKYLQPKKQRVVCLLSDGECNEGSTWEAALFASHHKLDNLTVIIDKNGLQGFGRTEDVMNMAPFADKWRSFGFEVREIDGHSFEEIHSGLLAPVGGAPLCVIAKTVKGKGVAAMEGKMEWHYLSMKPEHYEQALKEIREGGK
jgi:transketolase